MRLLRSTATATGIAVAVAFGGASAGAQGNVCLELEARLIQVERSSGGGGSADDFRQYDISVAQQRNEIERATAEARRAGCVGGFFIFQRRAEPKCPQLTATIDRMRANLTRLMRARSQSAGDPLTLARERNEIMRSLAFNRCGPGYAANGGYQEPGGLFQSLFGQARFSISGGGGFIGAGGFGAYRTLCVRSCDGYYFPISFSTLPGKFNADAATCQQMCPGTEATLYVHRNPGEDAASMVSLDGQPYSALPTAFRYRQQYDRNCSCGAPIAMALPDFTEFSTTGTRAAVNEALIVFPTTPQPRLRPAAVGEDPETVANRRGRLDPQAIVLPETEELAGVGADGRGIRIVGPAYYYAQ